jgi:hypothetical protein
MTLISVTTPLVPTVDQDKGLANKHRGYYSLNSIDPQSAPLTVYDNGNPVGQYVTYENGLPVLDDGTVYHPQIDITGPITFALYYDNGSGLELKWLDPDYIPGEAVIKSEVSIVYDTVSDMIADGNLVIGQYVSWSGYNQKNDGGGGQGFVVAASTGIADAGQFFDLSNGLQVQTTFETGTINSKQFGGVINVYCSPAGSDSNSGFIESSPFLTIQKALDKLLDLAVYYKGEVNINLAEGTYTEAIELNEVIRFEQWLTFYGPDVSLEPGRVPLAVIDGNSQALSNGLTLQNTRFRCYDIKIQNFGTYGFNPSNQCICQFWNCHASGNGSAGVNSEIQNRIWLYGGLYENNGIYGARIYSLTTLSGRVDDRVADSTQYCRLNNNGLYGMQIREYSQGRINEFICDGNSEAAIQVSNARLHLDECTLDNASIGIDARRKAEWFDDGIVWGAGLVERFHNYSFSLELSESKSRADEVTFVDGSAINTTGTTTKQLVYDLATIPASSYTTKTKQYELRVWFRILGTAGDKTITLELDGGDILKTIVVPALYEIDGFVTILTKSQGINSQLTMSNLVVDGEFPLISRNNEAFDMTSERDLSLHVQLSDAADSFDTLNAKMTIIT